MINTRWRERWDQLRELFVLLVIDRPYRVGKRIANRYLVEQVLGMGSYGISYLCRDEQTGQACVLKQVRPSKRRGNKGAPIYEYETSLLAALDHPQIPKLLDRFRYRGHLFFAMEHMNGKNLEDTIFAEKATYTEREALQVIFELLDIVEYLHQKGIVHRDVRIPNVIIADGKLRLIDFGLARRLGDKPTQVAEDLHDYVIEKQIKREVAFKSDFYSMGHFLLFLLYSGYEEEEGQEERSWEEELAVTPATRQLLRRMLQHDTPYETASELRADLIAAMAQKKAP